MSNHHVNWVLQYSGTKGMDRMVLTVLAHYATPGEGRSAPSMTTLVRLACGSERAEPEVLRVRVEAALLRLREAGLIEVDDAGHKPSFTIVMGGHR